MGNKRLFIGIGIGILFVLNLFFASWYVLHNDINFGADIARDFLLFEQIDEKKIVLIGPRSSVQGLFHGPLWMYLTYPGYVLGGGNPVTVGWWWIFLSSLFVVGGFFIARKLFTTQVAILFTLMLSLYLGYHTKGMINTHGAMFVIPFFVFFFIRYWQTTDVRFLLAHVLVGGLLIQFQMAIGVPFMVLSFLAIIYKLFKSKKYLHILSYLAIVIPLSTFIIFDLRHDFLISKGVFKYLTVQEGTPPTYMAILGERIQLLFGRIELLRHEPMRFINLSLFLFILFCSWFHWKDKKYAVAVTSLLYFYFGFFVLSFINRGPILYFYFYPLFPLVFLLFASTVVSRFAKVGIALFAIVYVINTNNILNDLRASSSIIGKDLDSWKFLSSVAQKTYSGSENEFGYFVYTPDLFAYNPKYAMQYQKRVTGKNGVSYEKRPVTYVVAAPRPPQNVHQGEEWWIKNMANINATPSSEFVFPNGYMIKKYELTPEEVSVPPATNVDLGLGFR